MTVILIVTIIFIVALLLGVPVAISLGVSSFFGFMMAGMPLSFMAQTSFDAVNSFTVIAVPMFILAGAIMEKGGLTKRLVRFAQAAIGNVSGGLAMVTVLACTLFAAISGSGVATTAAIGSMLIPAMVKEGYKKEFAGAVTACAGGIGAVIPPSILMIIYGVSAETSITRLFISGIFPGIMLGLFLIAAVFIVSHKRRYSSGTGERNWKELLKSTADAKWALLAPVIILGGIYSGIVTVTEASVISVIYALIISVFVYRDYSWWEFKSSVVESARTSGTVLIVMATGTMFGRLLSIYQVPQLVSEFLITHITNPIMLVLMIDVMLIFIGMWMESATQIIILTPLLLPVVTNLGINPVQFGIMFVIACEIGFETPPLGINLFVASEISDSSIEGISKEALIFVAAETFALILVSLVPWITSFLPNLLGM
jgi:C4-dicarboxylate transporter DctM subunit